MPISKPIMTPNGAGVSFHKAMKANVDLVAGTVALDVASWSNEADHNAGSGLVWMWPLDMPMTALADIDAAILRVAPFNGGTVVSDLSASLDAEKVRTWARIKAARDASIASGFTWDGAVFDSDDLATQRIQGAVQLAVLAAGAGQAFFMDWTLFDNTTRALSGADMIAVGVALGSFVQVRFAAGVALRAQVEAATSLDQLQQLAWTPL
jgi:hypothetical protein